MKGLAERKRGRPKKCIDIGVMFHMIKNNAPIAAVARYLGIHRDTLYVNYRQIIEDARKAHKEAHQTIWKRDVWPGIKAQIEKRQIEEAKREARFYRQYRRHVRATRRERAKVLFLRKHLD